MKEVKATLSEQTMAHTCTLYRNGPRDVSPRRNKVQINKPFMRVYVGQARQTDSKSAASRSRLDNSAAIVGICL